MFCLWPQIKKQSIQQIPDYYSVESPINSAQQLIAYLQDNTDVKIVYPLQEIEDYKQSNPTTLLYQQLDAHWNNIGAYLGAYYLNQELGSPLPEVSKLTMTPVFSDTGDLARMMGVTFPNGNLNYQLDGYTSLSTTTSQGPNPNVTIYNTNGATDKKIFIINDSFGTALMPFVASSFSSVANMHRDNFRQNSLLSFKPDTVVIESVERYLYDIIDTFYFSLIKSNIEIDGENQYVSYGFIDPSLEDELYVIQYWKSDYDQDYFGISSDLNLSGTTTQTYLAIAHGTIRLDIYTDPECTQLLEQAYIDY